MQNSTESKLSDNTFPNGILLNNQNFLQNIIAQYSSIVPNYNSNSCLENPVDISRILSPQQLNQIHNKPDAMKLLESYGNLFPIPKQPFEQLLLANSGLFNKYPPTLPMQLQMPYLQPFPINLMESRNTLVPTTNAMPVVNDCKSDSKPKHKLLKRHYDEIKQEAQESEANISSETCDKEAPFGRSKCGKPLKRPAFVPSYMDSFHGPYLCVVCSHKASGLHYKAMTCEGCKGFFRRTIQQNLVYDCKFNGDCEVSRQTKKDVCRSCRWNKCLSSGMAKNSVLNEDERKTKNELIKTNKLKRTQNPAMEMMNCEMNLSRSFNSSMKSEPTDESSRDETISDCSTNSFQSEWIKSLTSIYKSSDSIDKIGNYDSTSANHISRKIIFLIQHLPGFDKLNEYQKITLLQNRTIHCFLILSAFSDNGSRDKLHCSHESLMETVGDLKLFALKLDQFNLSHSEKSIIFALIFLFDYKNLLNDCTKIEELEIKYLDGLHYTTTDNIRRSKLLLLIFPTLTKLVNEFQNENYKEIFNDTNFNEELHQLLDQSLGSCEFEEAPLSLKIEEKVTTY